MNTKLSKQTDNGTPVLPSLLTITQLAARWACCRHTILRRKDLHPIRLGRRLVRYRREDIEAIEAAAAK